MTDLNSAPRPVRHTPLRLPVFGFGSVHLAELHNKVDETQPQATLQAVWDCGVRYFDTAPCYGRDQAEHRLSDFLPTIPRPARRYQREGDVARTPHSRGILDRTKKTKPDRSQVTDGHGALKITA